MVLSTVSFMILGILAVILSVALITRRSPVSATMLLIATFVCLAGMYGLLDAHFAAAAQIVVYAGAIMVVFVFVIMLLNLPPEDLSYGKVSAFEWVLVASGLGSTLLLATKIGEGILSPAVLRISDAVIRAPYYPAESDENIKNVASLMFTEYLWAFELISFLILAAAIGAVVIAKKRDVHA